MTATGTRVQAGTQSSPRLRRVGHAGLGVLGVVIVISAWQLVVWANNLDSIVLPTPAAVARELINLMQQGEFWHSVRTSFVEFLCGFATGTVGGVLLGVAMSQFAAVRMLVHPVIESLRFVVPFAWIPLAILWFGTSFWGKVFLVCYAVFFVIVVSTADAITHVDETLSKAGTMLGMGAVQLALTVQLRAAAPSIASACRAAAAIGWIAVVAAEYVGSSAGVGFLIINAEQSLRTDSVIAGMVVIGVIGAGISALIGWISRRWLSYA